MLVICFFSLKFFNISIVNIHILSLLTGVICFANNSGAGFSSIFVLSIFVCQYLYCQFFSSFNIWIVCIHCCKEKLRRWFFCCHFFWQRPPWWTQTPLLPFCHSSGTLDLTSILLLKFAWILSVFQSIWIHLETLNPSRSDHSFGSYCHLSLFGRWTFELLTAAALFGGQIEKLKAISKFQPSRVVWLST